MATQTTPNIQFFSFSPKVIIQRMNSGVGFDGQVPADPPELEDGRIIHPLGANGGLFRFPFKEQWVQVDNLRLFLGNQTKWEVFVVDESEAFSPGGKAFLIDEGTTEPSKSLNDLKVLLGYKMSLKVVTTGLTSGDPVAELIYRGIGQYQ